MRPHWGHLQHMGRHEHSLAGKHPFKPSGSRDHNHPHKPHKFGCPPPPEEKDEGGPPLMPPLGPRCQHPHFGINRTHRLLHNNSSSEQPPHGLPLHRHGPHGACPHGHPPHGPPPPGHHPHGPPPHGHHPHGPPPHGHHPHGPPPHGHHPHGPPPHGHHPHGPPPHGHHPHGPPPHGHHPQGPPPHGHHPHDFGPCVPPPHSQGPQDHHLHGHGPPHRHSGKRGPGKGHFPFHRKQFGYVHRLRPLNVGEVLPPPEANFPSFILPNCKSPGQSDILSFPESTSESCPGKFENILPGIAKFFSHIPPK
ncbi:histidine-rich glycoprotein-like [Ctenodactylus gundi]